MFNLGQLAFFGAPGIFELLIIGIMVVVPVMVVVAVVIVTGKKNRPPGTGNLGPCPDCNNAVSIRAQTCPHCGAPLKPMA